MGDTHTRTESRAHTRSRRHDGSSRHRDASPNALRLFSRSREVLRSSRERPKISASANQSRPRVPDRVSSSPSTEAEHGHRRPSKSGTAFLSVSPSSLPVRLTKGLDTALHFSHIDEVLSSGAAKVRTRRRRTRSDVKLEESSQPRSTPKSTSKDDYLTARGANPRTGLVTPGVFVGNEYVTTSQSPQAGSSPSNSKWRQKGDEWISCGLDESGPTMPPSWEKRDDRKIRSVESLDGLKKKSSYRLLRQARSLGTVTNKSVLKGESVRRKGRLTDSDLRSMTHSAIRDFPPVPHIPEVLIKRKPVAGRELDLSRIEKRPSFERLRVQWKDDPVPLPRPSTAPDVDTLKHAEYIEWYDIDRKPNVVNLSYTNDARARATTLDRKTSRPPTCNPGYSDFALKNEEHLGRSATPLNHRAEQRVDQGCTHCSDCQAWYDSVLQLAESKVARWNNEGDVGCTLMRAGTTTFRSDLADPYHSDQGLATQARPLKVKSKGPHNTTGSATGKQTSSPVLVESNALVEMPAPHKSNRSTRRPTMPSRAVGTREVPKLSDARLKTPFGLKDWFSSSTPVDEKTKEPTEIGNRTMTYGESHDTDTYKSSPIPTSFWDLAKSIAQSSPIAGLARQCSRRYNELVSRGPIAATSPTNDMSKTPATAKMSPRILDVPREPSYDHVGNRNLKENSWTNKSPLQPAGKVRFLPDGDVDMRDHSRCCPDCCVQYDCHEGCAGHSSSTRRDNTNKNPIQAWNSLSVITQPKPEIPVSPASVFTSQPRSVAQPITIPASSTRTSKRPTARSTFSWGFDQKRPLINSTAPPNGRPSVFSTLNKSTTTLVPKSEKDVNLSRAIPPLRSRSVTIGADGVAPAATAARTSSFCTVKTPSDMYYNGTASANEQHRSIDTSRSLLVDGTLQKPYDIGGDAFDLQSAPINISTVSEILLVPVGAVRMWFRTHPEAIQFARELVKHCFEMAVVILRTLQVLYGVAYIYSKTGHLRLARDVNAHVFLGDCVRSALYLMIFAGMGVLVRYVFFRPLVVGIHVTVMMVRGVLGILFRFGKEHGGGAEGGLEK